MKSLDLSPLRILVVENNRAMRSLLRTMLQGMGCQNIEDATTGLNAYDMLSVGTFMPDLVIVSWELPVLNGIETVYAIRSSNELRLDVPIIITTEFPDDQKIAEARDGGVDEFLPKPLSNQTLQRALASVVLLRRPFLRLPTFVGPDRRRALLEDYDGPERRQNKE